MAIDGVVASWSFFTNKVGKDMGPLQHICNIPRFYQILGEIFAFVLLEMIGNSQGFKTFESI
jgi:hypothetical protein